MPSSSSANFQHWALWLDGASAHATLELVRKGACYESSLDLASEQRMRVPPSTFITNQALKVAQIDRLFCNP